MFQMVVGKGYCKDKKKFDVNFTVSWRLSCAIYKNQQSDYRGF